jgi:hypothetical protein
LSPVVCRYSLNFKRTSLPDGTADPIIKTATQKRGFGHRREALAAQ